MGQLKLAIPLVTCVAQRVRDAFAAWISAPAELATRPLSPASATQEYPSSGGGASLESATPPKNGHQETLPLNTFE